MQKDYVIATPATSLDLYTAPSTTVPNCDLACSILPANDPVVSSFDPTTGAFTVQTGDKTLDGTTKSFTVTCTTSAAATAGNAGTTDTKDYEVTFVDECRNA